MSDQSQPLLVHIEDLEFWRKNAIPSSASKFEEALQKAKEVKRYYGSVYVYWNSDLTFEVRNQPHQQTRCTTNSKTPATKSPRQYRRRKKT